MSPSQYQSQLGGELLKSVSRSFYLTLRFLPGGMRGAASLGYLLARATDTVADTEAVPADERIGFLAAMGEAVAGADSEAAVVGDLTVAVADMAESGGEAELLRCFGDCLGWLAAVPDWQREAVQRVLVPIVRGQRDDLTRFGGAESAVLESEAELNAYTYDVAGCVGVFWTDLGFGAYGEKFARLSRAEMEELGARYGKGLQLLNILRDFPEDLAAGRCYLPGAVLADGGEAIWAKESPRWLRCCGENLGASREYIGALKGRRLRFATSLPALIGGKTLALLESASWTEVEAKVKVSRREVKGLMVKGAWAGLRRGSFKF